MDENEIIVNVGDGGTAAFVYSDDAAEALKSLGTIRTNRASYVEPLNDQGQWTADMAPIGGPVLGPFESRGDALVAERAWLREHTGL